jgi:hypothetical protein
MGILIFKGFNARRLYESFGVKGLIWKKNIFKDPYKFWFYELRNANDIQGTRGKGNSRLVLNVLRTQFISFLVYIAMTEYITHWGKYNIYTEQGKKSPLMYSKYFTQK